MIWIFGILFLGVLLSLIVLLWYELTRLIRLETYTALVLLDDHVQQDHKAKLKDLIAAARPDANSISALSQRTLKAVGNMAEVLTKKGLLLGVSSLIWNGPRRRRCSSSPQGSFTMTPCPDR